MKRLHARTKFSPIVAIIVLVALLISYCPAFAVPASPEIHTLSQADGSTFEAKKWGDEWLHGWETLDGYTILLDETSGNWVYATLSEDGQLAATGVPVSDARATEALPDLQPHIRPLATQPLFERTLPTTGTLNLPVLLVNFSDTTTTQTAAQFKSLLFDVNPAIATGPGSFRDYTLKFRTEL